MPRTRCAEAWINEVKGLGITISPSDVGEPECNGGIERCMRPVKEPGLGDRPPAPARAEGWRAAA